MMNDGMRAWADILERYGRNGDTMLAHITPGEARHLEQRGGSGTRNPHTGLLEFWGGDSPGTAGGGGGEGGDNGVGGPGNGSRGDSVSGFGDHGSLGGPGYSESDIGGPGGNGSNYADRSDGFGSALGGRTSFSDFANDRSMRAGAHEDEISERAGGVNWNDYQMQNYAKAGTFGRLGQELRDPSIKTSRWGAPTGQHFGFMGPALGMLAGPVFGAVMGLGAAMGRAQTPEEQAASMAEHAAMGRQNSGGSNSEDLLTYYDQGARAGLGSQPAASPEPSTIQQMAPARMTPESWDEDGFLARNPEVKAAVGNGTWRSGYDFNQAYQSHAGVPYETAMTYSQPDKYGEDLLSAPRNQVMPYKGY